LGAAGHRLDVLCITKRFGQPLRVAARRPRVDEHAQPDVIEPAALEDFEDVSLLAVIEVARAGGLVLRNPGDVGAEDERLGRPSGARNQQHDKQQPSDHGDASIVTSPPAIAACGDDAASLIVPAAAVALSTAMQRPWKASRLMPRKDSWELLSALST